MLADSVKFRGHRCFKKDWSGFDSFKPVNVIIGRNNTGKSQLLDLVAALCRGEFKGDGWQYLWSGIFDQSMVGDRRSSAFSVDELEHDWSLQGRAFVGVKISWETDDQLNPLVISFPEGFVPTPPLSEQGSRAREENLKTALKNITHPLSGRVFRRLLADRDIQPEAETIELTLGPGGRGATNIIRRFLRTSNTEYSREIIRTKLLDELNRVFADDGQFTEIEVQHHDEKSPPSVPRGHWEVYLAEKKKGLIPLSSSGSGLKTVILTLLNLLVLPEIDVKSSKGKSENLQYVFAFEELENNLHPALFRRLLQYIEEYAVKENATVFLTTHSSTALDLFGLSKDAQIIHVTHDGESARTTTVSAHFDRLGVVSELGAKPSDLLQANGVIWVEGPSDRIHINRWLDLHTGGRLREGRDYQCAFYGGSLLARAQFVAPQDPQAELANLFTINANIVVVCDGDRMSVEDPLKDRVERIRDEVSKIPGAHIWITEAKEIENYIPGCVLAEALERPGLPDPGQYEPFFPRESEPGSSFMESKLGRKRLDKVELAIQCAPYMEKDAMAVRFDWEEEMQKIVDRIDTWNK